MQASDEAGCRPDRLAIPHFRAGDGGPADAAAVLSLVLQVIDQAALEHVQPLCPTRSARAQAATGVGSVAEACALAAAGPGARLRQKRIASANATCAIAESAAEESLS
ncbi:cobalamin biosynthesis protein [Lichenicola sp.]|uniref:cobalamin biosynthesis protein n=1 Tax=Lichenicola sp. TaxID=2804529 RepID=UPI003AFFB7E4